MLKKRLALVTVCLLATAAGMILYLNPNAAPPAMVPLSPLKPGTYRVEYDRPDFRGWKAFVILEINSVGEIAQVTFDYAASDGSLKTQDAAYNQRMKAKNGLGPANYCPRFGKNLQIYQNPEQVDGITGATTSYRNFKQLAAAAFAAAKTGSQATSYLPQPEAVDPHAQEAKP